MTLATSSAFELFLEKLRSPRFRVAAPLLVLAALRFFYHRQRRHLEQIRLHRHFTQALADGHGEDKALDHRAVEEWHDVGEGVEFGSIVYLPKPNRPRSNVLVLIVPGNPGMAHFYLPLMREIVRRHGTQHEVRAVTHAGHYMPWKNSGKVFDLEHQHEHKVTYLRQRFAENPDLKLIIIGHSIGSYLTLKIVEAFPNQVAKIVLMQPTIHHIGRSAKGLQLAPVFHHRQHSIKIVKLLEFLVPMALRRFLVRLAIGSHQEPVLHLASLALVNRHVFNNVLHMADQEMKTVGDMNEQLLREHEHKTLFVYSPIDGWVPNEFVQMFQLRLPRAGHRMVPQSHGFMMDDNGTRDMADHISQWIQDAMVTE
ncbi:hypothetical protein Poli38472_009705 [Pythium oligandrum]|uniref:Lipid droplet-associated serine hydrolase n=1 Tax=Pythium oligandrum TaxID=41045 RepID=A0A8K1CF72_PYTOL|nr:hypothetical protein Poli38472_009705 [Pythium oligandrum]|eukprot:TMW62212.1 hypothetical protein Poli38472_009705 [Pythium oligandrum]